MKLIRVERIIANSKFTKQVIDKEYGFDSVVVYPPTDIDKIKPKRKENTILYVGRFSTLTQKKRQDVLIDIFKSNYGEYLSDFKLVIAGGGEVGASEYIETLRSSIDNYPIELIISPKFEMIKELYGKARFFWSAAGYEIDEKDEPEKVEHFGITVVEAMAGGAVPIIYNAGGHKEIIENGKSGFLWSDTTELIYKTTSLINNKKLYNMMSRNSKLRSEDYSFTAFKREIERIINKNGQ